MTELHCDSNLITNLNLVNNTLLNWLTCIDNQLDSIDISNDTLLSYFDCSSNQLEKLDISKNKHLGNLGCDNNLLSVLNVSENKNLRHLACSHNNLKELTFNTNYYSEISLDCHHNQLVKLILKDNNFYWGFNCSENNLTFATLPLLYSHFYYALVYTPQQPIAINKENNICDTLDLNDQYSVNGYTTTYTWKTQNDATLIENTDYKIANGKTTFLKSQTDSVYCEMTNDAFPGLILVTTFTKIESLTFKNDSKKAEIKIFFNPNGLNISLPYDAQALIFDECGRLILKQPVNYGINSLPINKTGIYLVKIERNNANPVIRKVVYK